jgi:hypothetical protein
MAEKVILMVGTGKGAFILKSDAKRKKWKLSEPAMRGTAIEYVVADTRPKKPVLYAAETNAWFGPRVYRSKDLGKNWELTASAPRFPEPSAKTVARIWTLQPGAKSQPDVLYAGVDPASMFISKDGGDTWEGVRGINEHPTREKWQPGAGGMCLHTILVDEKKPKRMFVAISAAGVFYTEDGGKTFTPRCKGIRAEFLPDKHPEFGQCVHKIGWNLKRPDMLYLQNHGGVYRTDDAGLHWKTIEKKLPAVFGFPLAVHPHDPDTVYIVPLSSDRERVTAGNECAVYRSRDRGKSWEALRRGLPSNAFLTVLRQAMATDICDPAGVYFGTRTGQLFGTRDEGDSWDLLADFLPPIFSVRAAVID